MAAILPDILEEADLPIRQGQGQAWGPPSATGLTGRVGVVGGEAMAGVACHPGPYSAVKSFLRPLRHGRKRNGGGGGRWGPSPPPPRLTTLSPTGPSCAAPGTPLGCPRLAPTKAQRALLAPGHAEEERAAVMFAMVEAAALRIVCVPWSSMESHGAVHQDSTDGWWTEDPESKRRKRPKRNRQPHDPRFSHFGPYCQPPPPPSINPPPK